MKTFLVTLLLSTVASYGLWNFGVAQVFWPAHPILATTLLAGFCGVVAQTLFAPNRAGVSARK